MRQWSRAAVAAAVVAVMLGMAAPAEANHSWGNYHWARTTASFDLFVGDNVDASWDTYLTDANSDWSESSVLALTSFAGTVSPRKCTATDGVVQVCNEAYGFNGWLGVAQIWVSGGHITKATMKVNDSYFSTSTYDTPEWRQMVMCQELGHTLGLDHQDEAFDNANLGTCMDYTNDPSTNQHPNRHDYEQLETVYGHVDDFTTVASVAPTSDGGGKGGPKDGPRGKPAGAGATAAQDDWGQGIRTDADGRPSLFERDLGADEHMFTFVIWARDTGR